MEHSSPLNDKKILFLSPSFFSYETRIKEAMERAGAKVYLYDERSIVSSFSRALLKVFPWIFSSKTLKYYRRIIESNKNLKFDYILIVKCDMISKRIIKLLRTNYPKAKLCLYLWDSTKNIKGINNKISLFDYASSFDLKDCENNKQLAFRPLFYTNDFINKRTEEKLKFDICFCGTIHSDRYFILKKLMSDAKNNGLRTFVFGYLQGHFIYYFYKFFAKGFSKAKKSEFSFTKKTISEISNIEQDSNVILDIQHPKQNGLTMRTIEMLGAKKKFITTNADVLKYDFYNPNNILVVDRKKPRLDVGFFNKPYEEIPSQIYVKYSINRWIIDVLGVKE